jgi:hypothetical protein
MSEKKDKGIVKLIANRQFDDGKKTYDGGQRITLSAAKFRAEMEKGRNERVETHPATRVQRVVDNNPVSPFLNHCRVVGGDDAALKEYEKFMGRI